MFGGKRIKAKIERLEAARLAEIAHAEALLKEERDKTIRAEIAQEKARLESEKNTYVEKPLVRESGFERRKREPVVKNNWGVKEAQRQYRVELADWKKELESVSERMGKESNAVRQKRIEDWKASHPRPQEPADKPKAASKAKAVQSRLPDQASHRAKGGRQGGRRVGTGGDRDSKSANGEITGDDDLEDCCVCMSECERKTGCGHVICVECARSWVSAGNGGCPICRRAMLPTTDYDDLVERYDDRTPDMLYSDVLHLDGPGFNQAGYRAQWGLRKMNYIATCQYGRPVVYWGPMVYNGANVQAVRITRTIVVISRRHSRRVAKSLVYYSIKVLTAGSYVTESYVLDDECDLRLTCDAFPVASARDEIAVRMGAATNIDLLHPVMASVRSARRRPVLPALIAHWLDINGVSEGDFNERVRLERAMLNYHADKDAAEVREELPEEYDLEDLRGVSPLVPDDWRANQHVNDFHSNQGGDDETYSDGGDANDQLNGMNGEATNTDDHDDAGRRGRARGRGAANGRDVGRAAARVIQEAIGDFAAARAGDADAAAEAQAERRRAEAAERDAAEQLARIQHIERTKNRFRELFTDGLKFATDPDDFGRWQNPMPPAPKHERHWYAFLIVGLALTVALRYYGWTSIARILTPLVLAVFAISRFVVLAALLPKDHASHRIRLINFRDTAVADERRVVHAGGPWVPDTQAEIEWEVYVARWGHPGQHFVDRRVVSVELLCQVYNPSHLTTRDDLERMAQEARRFAAIGDLERLQPHAANTYMLARALLFHEAARSPVGVAAGCFGPLN